jgi:hypothetical protein
VKNDSNPFVSELLIRDWEGVMDFPVVLCFSVSFKVEFRPPIETAVVALGPRKEVVW